MAALFALIATILTSWLPILNKYFLRDECPALMAWITNAASLPLLTAEIGLLTQCSLAGPPDFSLVCAAHLPRTDDIFVIALLASVVLNWVVTLLSTIALAQADASLVSPLLTFNPAFTLIIAELLLGEILALRQTVGVGWCCWGHTCSKFVPCVPTGLLSCISCSFGLERSLPWAFPPCGA